MEIDTERLNLRNLKITDVPNMFLMGSDPEVTKMMDYIVFKNEDEAKKWVEGKISSDDFAVELKDSHEFVGWIGIGGASDKSKGDLDFGYAFLPKHWGHGYAAEALMAVLKLSWQETDAKKIFGECRVENTASRRVMEKCGMKFETVFMEDGHESIRYTIMRTTL